MSTPNTFYNSENKIWSGPDDLPLYNPEVSVGQVILHVLNRDPNKIGQISANNGVSLTNRDLRTRMLKIVEFFKFHNLKEGDILGIVAKNSENLAPVVFAAFLHGTPINPLDTTFNTGDIVHMFGLTKPKLVFCDSDKLDCIKTALDELKFDVPIVTLRGKIPNIPSVEEILLKVDTDILNISPPHLQKVSTVAAAIMCSSGTTGLPKAVCISHKMFLQQRANIYYMTRDDVCLCFSSLYWLSGLGMLVSGTLSGSTRIITDSPFTPELFLNLIEQYKVTLTVTPPSQLVLCLQCPDIKIRDLSSLRRYICGGSLVPLAALTEMNRYLKNGSVCVVYGMSEVSGCTSINYPHSKQSSVGKLIVGYKVRIVNAEGTFLGPEQTGEICIKPYYPFLGYFGNSKATAEIMDDEGWIHSGDSDYFDNDGWLYVVDRIKEILKYKNFHIYPFEIEEVIAELPGVSQVCVISVPDLVYTDLLAAGVILTDGYKFTEEDIADYVASKMSDHKKLRGGVYFFGSFPLTASGKVKKCSVKNSIIKMYEQRKGIKQG